MGHRGDRTDHGSDAQPVITLFLFVRECAIHLVSYSIYANPIRTAIVGSKQRAATRDMQRTRPLGGTIMLRRCAGVFGNDKNYLWPSIPRPWIVNGDLREDSLIARAKYHQQVCRSSSPSLYRSLPQMAHTFLSSNQPTILASS